MKSRLYRLLQAMLAACIFMFAASSAFGLGMDYPNDKPVTGTDAWPEGMKHLVNSAHRVHGFLWDDEDVFFFSGSAAEFSAFLLEYSKINPVEKHVLILHPGAGKAFTAFDKVGPPCDWELYGCRAMRVNKDANAPVWYSLEVHFWTGGNFPLKQVTVPKNIELKMAE